MKFKILLYTCVSLFITAPLASEETTLKKVSFLPHWAPQAQFAGYYVAYERGIYKKYGLDITIMQGGPDSPPAKILEQGSVDFTTLWLSSAIRENDRGAKIVNIAQIMQKSALMLIAKKSSGIEKLSDINNKKVSLWGDIFQIQPLTFFKKYNLTVTIVPQSYSVNMFLRDGVDVTSAMWYNEYHTIMNYGYNPEELTTFFYYDYGLNFPEDGIYVKEDYLQKNPELCRSFVRASLEGWQYAFLHQEEALDIILKYMESIHVPANRAHQKWMLEKMKDLITVEDDPGMPGSSGTVLAPKSVGASGRAERGTLTDCDSTKPSGKLAESDYTYVSNCLKENGLINSIPEFDNFYKDCR